MCFQQDNGSRYYMNSSITITLGQIRKIKAMNKSAQFDAKFVSYILSVVFGDDVLRISSAKGSGSNFNGKRHMPLNAIKLSLVESMY